MKKTKINLFIVVCLLLVLGCERVIFLPIQGDIEGWVRDNNGQPVAGVTVSATFEEPSESGSATQQNKSTTTDPEGYYRLTDLWDEVLLSVNHSGLEPLTTLVKLEGKERTPQVDLTLNGSPTILEVTFDKTTLSVDTSPLDSITFIMEVADTYNSESGDYQGNLLLEDGAGNTRQIIAATVKEQSLSRILLEGDITTEDLLAGTYQVKVEIIDPDGNTHWISSNESIRLE